MTRMPANQISSERQVELVAAYERGKADYREYVRYNDNPFDYRKQPELSDNWCNGWLDAEGEAHPGSADD